MNNLTRFTVCRLTGHDYVKGAYLPSTAVPTATVPSRRKPSNA